MQYLFHSFELVSFALQFGILIQVERDLAVVHMNVAFLLCFSLWVTLNFAMI